MYLNTHSYYSLRYGTLSIEALLEHAMECGLKKFVLTDINCSTGCIEFAKECKKNNVEPVVGIEFKKGSEVLYIGIAKNAEGFKELNELLSVYTLHKEELSTKAPLLKHSYIVYPFGYSGTLEEHEYIGIRHTQLNKLYAQKNVAKEKIVALCPVTYHTNDQFALHTYLRAIDNNTLISKLKREDVAYRDERMLPIDELKSLFAMYPFIIENTERLLDNCEFEFEFKSSKNRKTFTGNRTDDKALLEKLAIEGIKYRYNARNKEAKRRVMHELGIIDKLHFSSYFLITWDIIRYSKSRNFYHVGRGSGANSIVAYCLGITDVDPIELDLYFERFLNPKRTSPPDFDIDYAWNERDDVLDYIFKRYGHEHTALLGTMSTFQTRSILRELGKVVGLPKEEIDHLLDAKDLGRNTKIVQQMMRIGEMMDGMPNQRSIHAGGVLISELPLTYYTALDMPPKGFPTVQWDMYAAEDIGFEKFDILSQRGIGHIKESVEIVKYNRNINIDVHDVEKFKKDEKVRQQLQSGDTIGCFYVESPAMRGLLKKLRCDTYISLVAASSIIRPGVAQSGMMREFIYRFHHQNDIKYLHPIMEEQLKETYGVMVFQEDVIKVCHHYAGLDLADADVLRRAMSGKYRSRSEFDRIVQRFHDGALALGRDKAITDEVWRQVASFAGYSFSKAHSASFAVESYQSMFLKAYYPIEHMVAVLNNDGGFYPRWLYVHEAKRMGATIHLPCVNKSTELVCVYGTEVYLGFLHILELEHASIERIISERNQNGEFSSLDNFMLRCALSVEQAIILIRVGAFRFTQKNKKELLWEVHAYGKSIVRADHYELFQHSAKTYNLPKLISTNLEHVYDEIELLGYPVSMTYVEMLVAEPESNLCSSKLIERLGQVIEIVGTYVTCKPVRTRTNKMMYYGTFIDLEGNFFDTTHFPNVSTEYPFKGNGAYLIIGKVIEEFSYASIEVKSIQKLAIMGDPRK